MLLRWYGNFRFFTRIFILTLKPMHKRIAEIQSYLQHNDHSLAVRRILDASLDTADLSLLQEAIQVSQLYRQYKEAGLPPAFFETANNLLNKIGRASCRE